MSLLSVRDLRVAFDTLDGEVEAVRGVSYDLEPGRILGVVGESGSGKTVSALSVVGLLPSNAIIRGGQIQLDDEDLLAAAPRRMRQIRGRKIGMVFQDPMTALNPVLRVGTQIDEALRLHNRGMTRRAARRRTLETLELVGVPDPARRANQYPHQWSGGMRQRAVIAIALANDPEVIIADEPTTALDTTVQAQVLQVLADARAERECAIIMITHDLGVIADLADDVVVMYAGNVVEACPAKELFTASRHPYTRALMRSRPGWRERTDELTPIPGRPPDLLALPQGCPFHPRCAEREGEPRCETDVPELIDVADRHRTACHRQDALTEMEAVW